MALPYELDGHAYDDAERVRDNKRQVTNYCPLCEHCARSAEKLNDENRALREENARLKTEVARCVEALNDGLLLTSSWADIRTHNWRNEVRAALAAAKGE